MNTGFLTSGPLKITVLTLVTVAGLLLFQTVKPVVDQESLINVPIEFTDLSDHLTISSASTAAIEILIKGPKEKLEHLMSPGVRLSLADSRTGDNHIPVTVEQLNLPPGVTVLNVQPLSVRVTVDLKISRELPIEIVCSGSPAKGYRLAGVLAQPMTVTVSGPQALIDGLDMIKTKAVDISGLSESCKKEAVFDIDPSWAVVIPQKTVIALISIAETLVVKKMDIPLIVQHPGASTSPDLASIEISGPENRFSALDAARDIQISIDVDGLKPGVYVRRATIRLPVDFTLISVKPELFTLTIK